MGIAPGYRVLIRVLQLADLRKRVRHPIDQRTLLTTEVRCGTRGEACLNRPTLTATRSVRQTRALRRVRR